MTRRGGRRQGDLVTLRASRSLIAALVGLLASVAANLVHTYRQVGEHDQELRAANEALMQETIERRDLARRLNELEQRGCK